RALIDGRDSGIEAVTSLPALVSMFPLRATEGSLGALAGDQVVVDAKRAKERGLHAGSTVRLQLSRGAARTATVVGIYADSDVWGGWLIGTDAVRDFGIAQPVDGFIRVAPGTSVATVKDQVDHM